MNLLRNLESKATFGSIHIDLQSLYNAIPVDLALTIIKRNEELRDAYSFYHSIHPIDEWLCGSLIPWDPFIFQQ